MRRGRAIGIAAIALSLGSGAFAQAAQPHAGAAERPRVHSKTHIETRRNVAAAPSRSVDQLRSDLIHGSAAQQDLEREDNEQAGARPIDHAKDAFFSDWHGFK